MPRRVVGGGGNFLEYDGRQVVGVGSIIADFHEGVQGLVSSTMVSEQLKLEHLIDAIDAIDAGDPGTVNNDPEWGAAGVSESGWSVD